MSTTSHTAPESDASVPVIAASQHLPEITPKALVLSIVLAAILAAANAYLGLFAGMTVSASIPAAVLSMSILRLFRRSNILENNIVQTAASSGEALAAGVIFTMPGLVILGWWDQFDYWQTATIALVGGTLGVIFTIPLRRALVLDTRLRFPEGVATAEVLKTGAGSTPSRQHLQALVTGAVLGGVMKFGEAGLRLWTEAVEGALRLGHSAIYVGMNLSPALLAVGFIVGLETSAVVFAGGVLGWLILLPLYGLWVPAGPELDAFGQARQLWSQHIRYVGIGAMLIGGIWTLIQIRRPIMESLLRLARTSRHPAGQATLRDLPAGSIPRTEMDTPGPLLLVGLGVCVLGISAVYLAVVHTIGVAVLMSLLMTLAAFLFSCVAGYMAGLVGSSSNPVSGVTIATIMLTSSLLLLILGAGHVAGPAAALLIGGVVCCAAAMGGDNLQDLKTGQLVGATPWKQQVMQLVGVGTGALVLAPTLSLLHAKYGLGPPTDAHPHSLTAPQATLMANLAHGMFGGGLPWGLVTLGIVLGGGVIVLDYWLNADRTRVRIPVLAVALGIYLPLKLTSTVMAGGLIGALVWRRTRSAQMPQTGLLAAAGFVTGEALMGILLAIPMALTSLWPAINPDLFQLMEAPPAGPWPGVVLLLLLAGVLYRTAVQREDRVAAEVAGEGRGGS